MRYYKIVHKDTKTLMCIVVCEDNENADDVCEILGSKDYVSVEITKEEYEIETEGI